MNKLLFISLIIFSGCTSQSPMMQPAQRTQVRKPVVLCDTRSIVPECRRGTHNDVKRAIETLDRGF